MIKMAIIALPVKPIIAAMGRKTAGRINNLMAVASSAGFTHLAASPLEKDAPTASSATGVAVPPMVLSVEERIVGSFTRSSENGTPSRMPRMIGFFATLQSARLTAAPPSLSGAIRRPFSSTCGENCRISTAYTLKNGTAESTIIGTMPASP